MAFAADRSVSVDEIEALLECPICMETVNEPRTLPCFHNFCKVCLDKYVEGLREGKNIETFPCPTCRSQFTLKSNENVEGMAGNYFIRNMLEVMTIQQQAKVSSCQSCEAAAVYRCLTCEMFMCENCCNWHGKWPANKKHPVLSINELDKPEGQVKVKSKLYCKKHQDKTLKFYCETCKELSCTHCMVLNHNKQNHSCVSVEEVAQKQREILESSCSTLDEKLSEGKKALDIICGVMRSLEENVAASKEKILQQKENILKIVAGKLDERVKEMGEEVDEIYGELHTELSKQHDVIKDYINKVQGSVLLSRNLLKKGSIEEILSSQKVIDENVEKLGNEQPEDLEPVNDGNIEYDPEVIDDINVDDLVEKMSHIGTKTRVFPTREKKMPLLFTGTIDPNLAKSSSILKDERALITQLQQWLGDKCNWNLCYRASRDGWRAHDFHRLCDNKGPTVVLIKVGQNIFGGYTDQNWAGYGYLYSSSSFLFSLRNNGIIPPFTAQIQLGQEQYAVYGHPGFGPTFGGGQDLYISDNAGYNQNSYSVNFGTYYRLPSGLSTQQAQSILAGSPNFTPEEVEVFI